jgi:hypothetical protein
LDRDGGEAQLSDEVSGDVVARVRPRWPQGRESVWRRCEAHREVLAKGLGRDWTVVKCYQVLARRGEQVPLRSLCRFCVEELGTAGRRARCGWPTAGQAGSCRLTSAGWV